MIEVREMREREGRCEMRGEEVDDRGERDEGKGR